LQSLGLNRTQVSDVAPLSGLLALQRLYLKGTQVSDVTPLSGLTALQILMDRQVHLQKS
jgi:internalin A